METHLQELYKVVRIKKFISNEYQLE